MRRLVFQSTDTKKPKYLASAGVVQGIDIREENGISYVSCLLGGETHIVTSGSFMVDGDDSMANGFLL